MKDYSGQSLEWLERRCEEVVVEMDGIRAQLQDAKIVAGQNNGYTPAQAEWRARAKVALHGKGREHQRLLRELSRKKRVEREAAHQEGNRSFERRFVEAARRKLDRDLYLDLCAEANAEADMAA